MVDGSVNGSNSAYPDAEREGLRPLRAHRAFIVVFVLSAMLSALTLTYIYSERHRAETTIFFKPSDVTQLSTHATQALGSPFPYTLFKVVAQTVIALVDSDALLRRVVTELHLDVKEPRDFSGPWYIRYYKEVKYRLADDMSDLWQFLKWGRLIEEDPVDQAIVGLRKQVKVRNDDSYVFTLQVSAKTPQRSVATANALAATLVELLARDDQRASRKRGEELEALRDGKIREIEDIEARIRDLLARNHVASVQEEIEKVTARASHLQQERSGTMADLRQSEGKVAGLAEKLRLPNPQTTAREEDTTAFHRVSRVTAEDYAKLTSDRLSAEVASGSLRARLDSIERSYAALVPRLQVLDQMQAEYDLMSAQLQSAKRDYTALTDAYQEAVIKATSGQSELHIQAKATASLGPVSPIKIYHVGAAGLLAALIAIGLAYVLDYFDIRLFLPPPAGRRRRRLEPSRAPAPSPEAVAARLTTD